jgi:hypothetical protein
MAGGRRCEVAPAASAPLGPRSRGPGPDQSPALEPIEGHVDSCDGDVTTRDRGDVLRDRNTVGVLTEPSQREERQDVKSVQGGSHSPSILSRQ